MPGHDIQVLDTLIATTVDSALGFEDAAQDAADQRLKSIFSSFASERRDVVRQLQDEVRRLGGTPENEGTAKAAAHRRWMDLKQALGAGDSAVVKSVEAGETYLRAKYEAALADDALSPATLAAVTDAYASIARGQARVIELRRCLGLSRSRGAGRLDWTAIGAAAAVAGLGYAASRLIGARRRETESEFAYRLETDEDMRLISSKKVEGTPVVGRDGENLGTIDSFMVDKYTGRVAYAVTSFGGTLGVGGSLLPLPWSALTYDTDDDAYRLNISKEELVSAPRFEPSDEPEFDTAYRRRIVIFYRPMTHGQYAH